MPREIGQYVIEYSDGKKETISLVQNWNITDIRSEPSLRHNSWSFSRMPQIILGSDVAWEGLSETGIPLNVQNFIWKNPYPEIPIRKIELKAKEIKQKLKIALLGITLLGDSSSF